MLIGICGVAGSGKDTVADFLIQNYLRCTKVALADPLKRICREVYDFTDEQLWGPSSARNRPDERYPREHTWKVIKNEDGIETGWSCACCMADRPVGSPPSVAQCFLTPRFALQELGTSWGRHCYANTWVNRALGDAAELMEDYMVYPHEYASHSRDYPAYDARRGLYRTHSRTEHVIIPDVRFRNEVDHLRRYPSVALIRLYRPGTGLRGSAGAHISEREQSTLPDDLFDYVIHNDKSIEDLHRQLTVICDAIPLRRRS